MTIYKPLILITSAITALSVTACAPVDYAERDTPQLTEKQQKKLDRKLAGRVAGEPVSCISQTRGNTDYTAISDDVLLYEVGNTVYINQPYGGCKGAEDNAVISKRTTSQLCSGEIMTISDVSTGIDYGSCSLGKFMPYRKADNAAD